MARTKKMASRLPQEPLPQEPVQFDERRIGEEREAIIGPNNGFKDDVSVKEKFTSLCERNINHMASRENETQETLTDAERRKNDGDVGLSDQRFFSCVTCGILSFDCVAIVQPKESATRYLMSADCSFFNDWTIASGYANLGQAARSPAVKLQSQSTEMHDVDYFYNVPIQMMDHSMKTGDQRTSTTSITKAHEEDGALGLLVLAYGDSSDFEEEDHTGFDAIILKERNDDQSGVLSML